MDSNDNNTNITLIKLFNSDGFVNNGHEPDAIPIINAMKIVPTVGMPQVFELEPWEQDDLALVLHDIIRSRKIDYYRKFINKQVYYSDYPETKWKVGYLAAITPADPREPFWIYIDEDGNACTPDKGIDLVAVKKIEEKVED